MIFEFFNLKKIEFFKEFFSNLEKMIFWKQIRFKEELKLEFLRKRIKKKKKKIEKIFFEFLKKMDFWKRNLSNFFRFLQQIRLKKELIFEFKKKSSFSIIFFGSEKNRWK